MSDLALLRLLQVCDSAFPVGGFAYSHGLEWSAHEGIVRDESSLRAFLETYVEQCAGRHWLPAALAAFQARNERQLRGIDQRFDNSFASPAERSASLTMGARLRHEAANAFRLEAGAADGSPGHFAVVFGCCARQSGVTERAMLEGLAFTMVQSVVQAALRLGFIGQSAATRLAGEAGPSILAAVDTVLKRGPRRMYGSFAPGIDVATTLQPTLTFRMFAS